MDVLVAGGTGFIGANLCRELAGRGHDVTALARNPDDVDPDVELPTTVDRVAGDATDYDSIAEAVAGRDAVVNLVSLSPLYQPPPGTSHEAVHLGGTRNLLRAAEAGDVRRFVQMSALGADPDGPTAYIRAKGHAETLVRDSDLEWVIVRPSVVFGDGDEFVGFTKRVSTPYVTGLPGGGKTRFQPIWIDDLCPMLADCAENGAHAGTTYELGGPTVLTLADVTRLVYAAAGQSVRVVPIPMALATVAFAVAGRLPLLPFGVDQARSLRFDNTVADNDVDAFGVDESDMRTLGEYLGTGRPRRRPKRSA